MIYGDARLTILKKSSGSIWYKLAPHKGDLSCDGLWEIHAENAGFKRIKIDEEDGDDFDGDFASPGFPWAIMRNTERDPGLFNGVMRGLSQTFLPAVVHSGPLRGRPERFYNFERKFKASGSHFASMWHDMVVDHDDDSLEVVRKFGRDSQLFEDLNIARVSAKVAHSPLMVTIKKRGKNFLLDQVGVGISQVIPVIIESVFRKTLGSDVAMLLQQPELHLHPIAQAALGEFLFEMTDDGL
ncbi:hypothetical protein Q9L58_010958, partial [Maublancomyces gigas]